MSARDVAERRYSSLKCTAKRSMSASGGVEKKGTGDSVPSSWVLRHLQEERPDKKKSSFVASWAVPRSDSAQVQPNLVFWSTGCTVAPSSFKFVAEVDRHRPVSFAHIVLSQWESRLVGQQT